MYGSSYMFRHYIVIFRERSWCLVRDAQLRSSRQYIVDGRVVPSDVMRGDLRSLRDYHSQNIRHDILQQNVKLHKFFHAVIILKTKWV
jgi:hypothetical protein